MKIRKRVVAVAALAPLATAASVIGLTGMQPAIADTQLTAIAEVNIRSGPGMSYPVVGGLYRSSTATAVASSGGWTKIRFMSGTAYVASRYLTHYRLTSAPGDLPSGSVKITTIAVNVRTGPGLSYRIIDVLGEGTRVTLLGRFSHGFALVQVGSAKGWVSMQYLASSFGLPKVGGVRVATADLLIRTTAGSDFGVIRVVPKGTQLFVTGVAQNGRAQIIFGNAVRWVTAKYLATGAGTAKKPSTAKTPSTTKKPSTAKKPPAPKTPSAPRLPRVIGIRYATTALLVRSTWSNTFSTIAEVPKGAALSYTGVQRNGRAQIIYKHAVRWVTAQYLSTKRPSTSTPAPKVPSGSPQSIARQLMASRYGWGSTQFSCYNSMIMRESEWKVTATNPSSGAYGIPQALPASKMATAGSDWRTNPATQIRWGLSYVKERYGTPCSAWAFWQAHHWY